MPKLSPQSQELDQLIFTVADGYYDQNIWDLRQHPSVELLNEKQKTFLFQSYKWMAEFPTEGNYYVNTELKLYCIDLLESGYFQLTTFVSHFYSVPLISEFVNITYPEINSIVEIPLAELEVGFEQFLQSKNHITAIAYGTTVNGKMEITKYTIRSIPLRFIRRFHKFYKNSIPVENFSNEIEKDKWDIRNLTIQIDGFDNSRPRYILNFSNISQENIKAVVKIYIEKRLTNGIKFSTCQHDLKGIDYLSSYLKKNHPAIQNLHDLNRKIIEGFLGYVELSKIEDHTKTSRISCVKTFFEFCEIYNLEGHPTKTFLFPRDLRHKDKKLPRPIPKYILNQLVEKMGLMSVDLSRMLIVIYTVGMRIGELCNLTTDCIHQLSNGSYYIEYLQVKTMKMQSICVELEIAKVILAAIEHSKILFGQNVKYVFSQNASTPISQDKFVRILNNFSYDVGIKDKNGDLYRFKTHQFRHSVATRYINMGVDLKILQYLMGWSNISPYLNYVELHDETLKESIKPLLNHFSSMIRNIGKRDAQITIPQKKDVLIPLSNGWCTKPLTHGNCEHGYGAGCYVCSAFIPTKEDLPIYEFQCEQAHLNVQIALLEHDDQLLKVNQKIITGLECIIAKIKKETNESET